MKEKKGPQKQGRSSFFRTQLVRTYKDILVYEDDLCFQISASTNTVEPLYNEDLGTMKITLLYQVSCYIRVKTQRNIKSWD